MKKQTTRKDSFGQAVIDSMRQFLDAAKRGEPITARKVKLDLEPRAYGRAAVKELRATLNVSQAMFAKLLAVSVKLVQGWESGSHKPSPLACRLLDEISIDPKAWLDRQMQRGSRRGTAERAGVGR
jgi:DNA-binding transcriptional regulator YiaG